jgi:hypothetical protein
VNTRKNRLWKQLDETAKQLGVPRSTLYRWIAKGRLGKIGSASAGVKKVDGFTFLDVYAVAEIISQPRQSRGRMLAIQKVREENRRERSQSGEYRNNCTKSLSQLSRATAKITTMIDRGEMSGVMQMVLLSTIAGLKKLVESAKLSSR